MLGIKEKTTAHTGVTEIHYFLSVPCVRCGQFNLLILLFTFLYRAFILPITDVLYQRQTLLFPGLFPV